MENIIMIEMKSKSQHNVEVCLVHAQFYSEANNNWSKI